MSKVRGIIKNELVQDTVQKWVASMKEVPWEYLIMSRGLMKIKLQDKHMKERMWVERKREAKGVMHNWMELKRSWKRSKKFKEQEKVCEAVYEHGGSKDGCKDGKYEKVMNGVSTS